MSKRQKQALPILDELEQWMETTYPKVLPKSQMGQAIAYAYTLWPRMRNYLKDGKLKIDNNLAENAIRPIALSRKTSCFVEIMKRRKTQMSSVHYWHHVKHLKLTLENGLPK